MMESRINASIPLMEPFGAFMCHIDENEYELLHLMLNGIGIPNSGTIIWDKKNPMLGRKGVATQNEYILWRSNLEQPIYSRNKSVQKIIAKAAYYIEQYGINSNSREKFAKWIKNQQDLTGGERAYQFIDDNGGVFRGVAMGAPEPRANPKFHIPLLHPITKKECPVPPNGWSRTPETLKNLMDNEELLFGKDETTQPQKKVFMTLDTRKQLSSIIQDAKSGKSYLDNLGLFFPYCHPVSLYEELFSAVEGSSGVFLDYFAGSGTTAHAIINLNREDEGNRSYILFEMGDYINTIVKPRIQKIVYSNDWKDGKPISRLGLSHMFKYLRLESYEDTLNNLVLSDESEKQLEFLDSNKDLKEEYMLSYWLNIVTKESSSLLNLERFKNPFNYKLNIATESVGASKPTTVDLVETFNYLIGLNVDQIDTIRDFKVIKGKNPQDETVLIIWRNLEKKDNKALEDFMNKQKYHPRDTEFDNIYVNGDHTLEDPKSKVKMIEIEFKRLMFDFQDI
jgi:adenine-specific DNA-methyltransferase